MSAVKYEASGAFAMAVVGGPGVGVPWGLCALVADHIANDHPELEVVGGQVLLPDGGQFDHWWCVAPDGTVVDPMTDVTYGEDVRRQADPAADIGWGVLTALHRSKNYEPQDGPCQCDQCMGASV